MTALLAMLMAAMAWGADAQSPGPAATTATVNTTASQPTTATQAVIAPDQIPGQTTDAIVARVNGKALLLSSLKEAAFDQSIPLASLMSDGIRSDGYRRAITLLVDQTLLEQKAVEDGIEVDEMKVSQAVEEMIGTLKRQLGGDAELDKFLETRHLRQADLREMFRKRERRDMLITQLVSRNVRTDNQRLEEFIAERKAKGLPVEEINLAQILVMARPDQRDTEKGRERYERAIFAARQAGKDPTKFGDVAAEYSDEPLAKDTGGYIGWVDPTKLRPALADRLKTMKIGEISEPVETDLGYHILLLIDRRTARDLLYAQEFARERTRLIRQLREDASIQLFDLNGQAIGRLAIDETAPSTATEPLAAPAPF